MTFAVQMLNFLNTLC